MDGIVLRAPLSGRAAAGLKADTAAVRSEPLNSQKEVAGETPTSPVDYSARWRSWRSLGLAGSHLCASGSGLLPQTISGARKFSTGFQ
jgi:hypothetical protein